MSFAKKPGLGYDLCGPLKKGIHEKYPGSGTGWGASFLIYPFAVLYCLATASLIRFK